MDITLLEGLLPIIIDEHPCLQECGAAFSAMLCVVAKNDVNIALQDCNNRSVFHGKCKKLLPLDNTSQTRMPFSSY